MVIPFTVRNSSQQIGQPVDKRGNVSNAMFFITVTLVIVHTRDSENY